MKISRVLFVIIILSVFITLSDFGTSHASDEEKVAPLPENYFLLNDTTEYDKFPSEKHEEKKQDRFLGEITPGEREVLKNAIDTTAEASLKKVDSACVAIPILLLWWFLVALL